MPENILKNVLECHVKIEKVEKKVEKGVVVASTDRNDVYYINYKKSVKITHIFLYFLLQLQSEIWSRWLLKLKVRRCKNN